MGLEIKIKERRERETLEGVFNQSTGLVIGLWGGREKRVEKSGAPTELNEVFYAERP